jgi:hypothetical protein
VVLILSDIQNTTNIEIFIGKPFRGQQTGSGNVSSECQLEKIVFSPNPDKTRANAGWAFGEV